MATKAASMPTSLTADINIFWRVLCCLVGKGDSRRLAMQTVPLYSLDVF
jgi:hypothetical protein